MIKVQWFYCQTPESTVWMGYCPDLSLIIHGDTELTLIQDMYTIPYKMFEHMMNEVEFEKFVVIQGLNQWPHGEVVMKDKIKIEVSVARVERIEIPH